MRNDRIAPVVVFPKYLVLEVNVRVHIEITVTILVEDARLQFPELRVIEVNIEIGGLCTLFAITSVHCPFSTDGFLTESRWVIDIDCCQRIARCEVKG